MPKKRNDERKSDRLVDADPRSSELSSEGDKKSLALDDNDISELPTNHISPRKRSLANLTQQAEGDEGEPSQADDCDSHSKQRRMQSSEDDSGQGSKSDTTRTLQHRWDSTFDRLTVFKEKHGHCLVPNRYDEDRSLGAWVSTQRRNYKTMHSGNSDHASTILTAERARKLDEIGFVWATSDPRHCPWEVRFEQLRAYKEKFGDALVPIRYTDNTKLANWVSTQRQDYKAFKEGRQTRMTRERIDMLQSNGMVWDAQRGGNRHRRRYRSNIEYTTSAAAEPPSSIASHGKRRTPAADRGISVHRVPVVASSVIMETGTRDVPTASSSHRESNTPAALASISNGSSGTWRCDLPTSDAILPPRHDGALFALANPLRATATGSLPQRDSLRNIMNPLAAATPAAMIEALVARRHQEQNALQAHMHRRLTAATVAAATRNNPASTGGTRATAQALTMGTTGSSVASRLLQHTSELETSAYMRSLSNLSLSVEQYLASNMLNPQVAGLSTMRDHPSSLLAQYGLGTSPFVPATYSGSLLHPNGSMQLPVADHWVGHRRPSYQGLTSATAQSLLLQAHLVGSGHGMSSHAQRATSLETPSLSFRRRAAVTGSRTQLQRRARLEVDDTSSTDEDEWKH